MSNYIFATLSMVEPHPFTRRFLLVTFVIIFISLSFLFLPWQQTVKGVGSVLALNPTERAYPIVATIDGFIDKFYVQESQYVKKGTLLFTMVDLDVEYEQRLKEIQNNIYHQQKNLEQQIGISQEKKKNIKEYLELGLSVYSRKFEQIKNKIRALDVKKVSLEKKYDIEELNFQRVAPLYAEGIESKRKYDILESYSIAAKANVQKVLIDIEIENDNIIILNQEKEKFLRETKNKVKSLETSILFSKNKIRVLKKEEQKQSIMISRYSRADVRAQKDGYVVRLYENDKNKLIKKGNKVIYFAPVVTEMSILLKVSDFNMPLIKNGLPTRIIFYGWPAMQVSGWPKIKRGTFGGMIKKVDSLSYEKGFYYAYVVQDPDEPWPSSHILKVGTQATVWIRLETVPMWYQLWRIINALPPQMPSSKKVE